MFCNAGLRETVSTSSTIPNYYVSNGSASICVGRHVANNSLFIDIACLLWAASIAPVKDEHGKPIIPVESKSINDGLVV